MNKWLKILSLDIEYIDNVSFRRVLLISSISIVTMLVFVLFFFINLFIVGNYSVAALDFIAAGISLSALFLLKHEQNIPKAAKIATLNLFLFFLSFVYVNGSSHFSLIWTIFLPIFATLTNGKKVGLYFSLVFYTLLFTLAFLNIGIWAKGEWQYIDLMRFVAASSILTFTMYMNEKSLEESDKKLEQVRRQEKQLLSDLHNQAITDELTKMYNRRYFYDMIPKLTALAKRKHQYITFFILDIDYFKNYNDYYGHMKGDDVLIEISKIIKQHIQRDDDFVFRLGGEEFAGIIISDDKEKTHEHVMQLCRLIESQKIEHVESLVSEYITASIGIATVAPAKEYDLDMLYNFADQALYCAKNNGRNRSELSFRCA